MSIELKIDISQSPDDLLHLVKEWRMEPFPFVGDESLKDLMRDHHTFTLIGSVDLQSPPIACLIFSKVAPVLDILYVYTSKAFRGKGYADLLIENLKHRLTSPYESIHLEVSEKNTTAMSLYEKHGFVFLRRRPHYYSSGDAALVYSYSAHK